MIWVGVVLGSDGVKLDWNGFKNEWEMRKWRCLMRIVFIFFVKEVK